MPSLLLLTLMVAIAHAAAQVSVLPGYTFDGGRLHNVQIEVLTTGVGSNVWLIYSDGQGTWRQPPLRIPATYSRPATDVPNREIWTIDDAPLVDPAAGIQRFYIQYSAANGKTYYGNNNGANYPVVAVTGPQPTTTTIPPSPPTTTTTTATAATTTTPVAPPTSTGVCEPVTPAWSPNVDLIDTSDFYTQDKPQGGWFVTPIHATLLQDGQIYIVGWNRRDYINCVKPLGTRKHGVSFVIPASAILAAARNPPPPNRNPTLTIPRPIPDQRRGAEDTLYCSGQVTMKDGRVFVVGGASYRNLGMSDEMEVGVSYARVYDPKTGGYSTTPDAPIGTMWYPTAAALPSGDILVTGGFARCCNGDSDANDNAALYHPTTNAWSNLGYIPNHLITPGIRDYTHIFVLPRPITLNNRPRHVAMMGEQGTIVYYNTDVDTPNDQRVAIPTNAGRPSGGGYDATAFQSPTGALITLGGGSQPWTLDAFTPSTSTWTSTDGTFSRDNPTSVLLPDGTVLFVNGKNRFDASQSPPPQLYNPFTGTLTTLPGWSNDPHVRAYHSWAILLQDGRVAVGGGIDHGGHDIACERVDVRIFTPPYLQSPSGCVTRPVITSPGVIAFTMRRDADGANPATAVTYTGPRPRTIRGAALMALGSSTHSFDQNQRYVALDVVEYGNGALGVSVRAGEAAIEGVYNLFLVSEAGVPSVGVGARIVVV
ncbi:uncharacterized protein EV422DRAFT_572640 [Fimicolochytrium jonesii]|uniref:uncharacterized protein n=1 Tax=Fimicolochytrium jonesii TaxID=1396493 RepID=UPI0022FE3116|nr:uncharacterized protein EV422DRAFT_572640 [Fimicolochytrium jonesii]KAI8815569.1 hypothetical protein EV422DRAFT_572640 [Fimicolochytrium jonesii]